MNKLEKITLLGSSSGRNAGDAALIAGIMDAVDNSLGKKITYEIPTVRPSYIRDNYRNVTKPVSMLPWNLSLSMFGLPTYKSLHSTDMSLIFDAILFDRSLYNPLFNYMSTLYYLLPALKKKGKKLGMYSVGAGPVDSTHGQKMLREIAELMDFITVRDTQSYKLLRDIGVKNTNMLITADAAVTVQPSNDARIREIFSKLNLSFEEEILGVNVNVYLDTWVRPKRPSMGKEKFVAAYAQALNKFLSEVNAPLLFVCTQHHDVPLTKEIMERIQSKNKVRICTNTEYNHYDMKGVLGKLSLLFGMRLHSSILATSALTPTISIEFQAKVAHYFDVLGQRELCFSFDNFSPENLYKHIVMGWTKRKEIRAHLEKRIPEVQQKALIPAEIIREISLGNDISKFFTPGLNQISQNG